LNAGELPSYTDNHLKREINRMIGYPSNLKSNNAIEVVLVAFRIEPCGTISIDEVNSSRADFAEYVVEKLNAIRFESGSGEQMCMRFTFKKQ
jgi:pyoverdine/dityrosine biosynthesis protein Dit1